MTADAESATLGGLKVFAAIVAALGTAVYVAGGIVLAGRLAFAELPALGVIGQLPREFLLSLGAIQVVGPAIVLGAAIGVVEFLQGDPKTKFCKGFQPWSEAKTRRALRCTYLRFYAGAPFVLLAPGLCVALARDENIDDTAVRIAAIVASVAAALTAAALWAKSARKSRISKRCSTPKNDSKRNETLDPSEQAWLVSGGAFALICAIALTVETGSARYFWVVGAWGVMLLLALLLVWLRSAVRTGYLTAAKTKRSGAAWIVLAWASTALFLLPGFVVLAVALPLQPATLCTQPTEDTTQRIAGRFIGETKERAYVGDANGRIISVPASKVSRLAIGGDGDNVGC